jgi:hypothetical protein
MLAFDRAARLYRLSLEYHPGARELRVKLGDALVNAGRGAEAARAYLAARAGATPVAARILSRRAAEQFLFSGHVAEGCKLMREVLQPLGMDLPRSQARSIAALLLGRARLRLRGFHFSERAAAEVSPELLERIDACWSVAHGFGMIDVLVSQQFHTKHLLLALDAGEPYRIARGLAIEPTTASAGGDFARSDALVAQAQALAERLGNAHALGLVHMEAATVWFMRGEFRRARELFERAEQLFRDRCTGVAVELATTFALKLYSCFYLGDMATLAQLVPDQIRQAEERGDLFAALSAKMSYCNLYWLLADDAEGARREADDAVARWSSDGFHVQHFAALTAQVNIDLYRGDGVAAWRRVQEQWRALTGSILFRVESSRMEAHSLRGRAALAAAHGDGNARDKLLAVVEEQARAFDKARLRHTRGQAQLLRAGAAATRDDRARALVLLDEAVAACAAGDLALHAAAARYRRGQLAGDERLRDAGLDFLRRQRVRAPARFFAMIAPGFTDDIA